MRSTPSFSETPYVRRTPRESKYSNDQPVAGLGAPRTLIATGNSSCSLCDRWMMKWPPSSHSNVMVPGTTASTCGRVASVTQVPISAPNGLKDGIWLAHVRRTIAKRGTHRPARGHHATRVPQPAGRDRPDALVSCLTENGPVSLSLVRSGGSSHSSARKGPARTVVPGQGFRRGRPYRCTRGSSQQRRRRNVRSPPWCRPRKWPPTPDPRRPPR